MHSTHCILVNIPSAAEHYNNTVSEMTKAELKEMVIAYAESRTEDFYGWVYDGRELLDEADGYQPVIFSNENWSEFEDILLSVDSDQKNYAKEMLEYLKEEAGSTDVSDILSSLLLANDRTASRDSVDPDTWKWDYLNQGAYALKQIAHLIHGDYNFDSEFYDTYRGTALVPFIAQLKETPDDWALVQFDYHY